MSIPSPPIDLKGHCSAVMNNTLYLFSPAGFQSLSLSNGSEWRTLPSGTSVTGGVCATANDVLYIVGGSANATSASYPGLQRYSVSDGSWATIPIVVPVTKDRQNHGATYINSTSSILVFAGSQVQGDTLPSSQTFLISTIPPYGVLSFSAQAAPPLFAPMVMPWDDKHALMIGGDTNNKRVLTFGQPEGWIDLGTSLTDPISDPTTTQCTIATGDDGSKVLQRYDMGVIPNQVTRYALWADGKPATVGRMVGAPASRKRKKRSLTVDNWPAYNSTLAPTVKRIGYSLAQSSNGLAVMTGGASDPIAIFDQRQNTWINATSLLAAKNQIPLTPTTSSTSLPSVSVVAPVATASSPSPSSRSGAAGMDQPKDRVLKVLGGTLGAIVALGMILIAILLYLRWRRKKHKSAEKDIDEKEGRLSFADQGAEFMHEAGGSRGRAYSASLNSSVASLQLFTKGSKTKTSHRRGMASDSSQMGLVKSKSPLGFNEPLELSPMSEKSSPTLGDHLAPSTGHPLPKSNQASLLGVTAVGLAGSPKSGDGVERSRSNGWSRYFANNEVTNLASMQSGRSTYGTDADTYRTSIVSRSEYDDRNVSSSSVRPLELNLGPKFDGQRLSRVASGSPTLGQRMEDVQQGQSARISRADSKSSRGSADGDTYADPFRDGRSTRIGASTTTAVSRDTNERQGQARDTKSISSMYSNNENPYHQMLTTGYPTNDPHANLFDKPSIKEVPRALPEMNFGNHSFGEVPRNSTVSQGSAMTVFPSGLAGSPKHAAFPKSQLASELVPAPDDPSFDFPMPRAYFGGQQSRDSNTSNVTIFPRGVPSPTTNAFAKPTFENTKSPTTLLPVPPASNGPAMRRGPVLRKTTGDEDMSWLNINAGRAI